MALTHVGGKQAQTHFFTITENLLAIEQMGWRSSKTADKHHVNINVKEREICHFVSELYIGSIGFRAIILRRLFFI